MCKTLPTSLQLIQNQERVHRRKHVPMPRYGKGTTQLILDGVEDPSDFDKFVLALFEKNMALEGTFNAQMQRYFYNDGDKLVSEETNPVSLRLVVVDDKVDEVLNILDQQN